MAPDLGCQLIITKASCQLLACPPWWLDLELPGRWYGLQNPCIFIVGTLLVVQMPQHAHLNSPIYKMGYISSIQFPLPGNWREKKKKTTTSFSLFRKNRH